MLNGSNGGPSEWLAQGQVVSAWSRAGKGLPFAAFMVSAEDMDRIAKGQLTSTRHMADMKKIDPAVLERARIPVERITGPVLLISGSDDQPGPSDESARMVIERLARYKHPYEYKHVDYAGAGHLVFLPQMITGNRRFMNGGHAKADAHGGVAAWAETLDFLRRHFDASLPR